MNSISKLIKNQIAQELNYINEHNAIKEILKPLEGKEINKRTLNEKRLNGFKLDFRYGMFHIVGKYNHLLAHKSGDNLINIDLFEKNDACHYSAAQNRIEKLNNLDVKKLTKIQKGIDKNFNALRTLFGDIERENLGSFHNPIYYNMLNDIYKESSIKDIKLTDFYFIKK